MDMVRNSSDWQIEPTTQHDEETQTRAEEVLGQILQLPLWTDGKNKTDLSTFNISNVSIE